MHGQFFFKKSIKFINNKTNTNVNFHTLSLLLYIFSGITEDNQITKVRYPSHLNVLNHQSLPAIGDMGKNIVICNLKYSIYSLSFKRNLFTYH